MGGQDLASMACVMMLGMRPKARALPPTTAILRPDRSIRLAVGVLVILTVRQRTLDCRDMGGIFLDNNVLMVKQVPSPVSATRLNAARSAVPVELLAATVGERVAGSSRISRSNT